MLGHRQKQSRRGTWKRRASNTVVTLLSAALGFIVTMAYAPPAGAFPSHRTELIAASSKTSRGLIVLVLLVVVVVGVVVLIRRRRSKQGVASKPSPASPPESPASFSDESPGFEYATPPSQSEPTPFPTRSPAPITPLFEEAHASSWDRPAEPTSEVPAVRPFEAEPFPSSDPFPAVSSGGASGHQVADSGPAVQTALAPGWHPDDTDPSARRYWDGEAWVSHIRWDGAEWVRA
jgi:hypothetical protein